ncbi:MAG: hypothetical protein DRQ39_10475 [Gammaproteobacteria bacterium]|nr:MAG: hypothetical protein DRQ39_10475 [Gammaproteobacteria bacterium]
MGHGEVTYRTGKPGQDHRTMPYADIEWNDPIVQRCPVCLGMKVQQPKKNYPPPRTEIYWNTPLTDEEVTKFSSTDNETIPLEAYDGEEP